MNPKYYLFLCALILCGCATPTNKNEPTLRLPVATFTETSLITLTTPPTSTTIPTNTPDPNNVIMGSEMRCLEEQPGQAFAEGLVHTQLVTTNHWAGVEEYTLLDFNNPNARQELPTMNYLEISPDKKHVFYLDCPSNKWEECSYTLNDGQKVLKSYPTDAKKDNWQGISWLDNEHILAWQSLPDPAFVVFNPFTGEEKSFSPNLPGVFLYPIQTMAANFTPDLKRAIYFTKVGEDRVVLWDMEKQNELARMPISITIKDWLAWEGWSFDRKIFSVAGLPRPGQDTLEDLFVINMDGTVQQITRFSDFYQTVLISSPSWSPDGRFISFQLQVSEKPNDDWQKLDSRLMLADLETKKVINLCKKYGSSRGTIWSPDSKYLAIKARAQISPSIQIVDVYTGKYQLIPNPSEGSPIGWILSPLHP